MGAGQEQDVPRFPAPPVAMPVPLRPRAGGRQRGQADRTVLHLSLDSLGRKKERGSEKDSSNGLVKLA